MGQRDRRRQSRSGRIVDALVWGAALGAASGAALGAAVEGIGAAPGSLIGAVLLALVEVTTTMTRVPRS